MKISFEVNTFLKAFRLAAEATLGRDVRPILTQVKIEAGNSGVVLHATTTEIGIRIRVKCDVAECGTVIVPVKRLIDLLTLIKAGQAVLESDGKTIVVVCGKQQLTLDVNHPADDFPDVAPFDLASYHCVCIDSMNQLIKRTVPVVEKTGFQTGCTGVCFNAVGSSLTAVATDGVRMVQHNVITFVNMSTEPSNSHDIKKVVVPLKALNLLQRAMREKVMLCGDTVVRMGVKADIIMFLCGSVTIFASVQDERIPRLAQFKWKEKADCIVDSGILLSAVKRMRIFTTHRYPCTVLTFDRGRLTLTACGEGVGRCENVVPLTYAGEKKTVKLECKQLIDMLQSLTGKVSIYFSECGSDVVMFTAGSSTCLQGGQKILPEELDKTEWERRETRRQTRRQNAILREELAYMKFVLETAIEMDEVDDDEVDVPYLEAKIAELEEKCAALPVDDESVVIDYADFV